MDQLSLGPLAVWRHPAETKTPRARVLLIHGLSEHSGRHLNTVHALVKTGFEVVRFDLRGSGESGGRKQWISTFMDYVEDTSSAHNWICGHLPPLPLFVLGHSLGGAIAIYFAGHYHKQLRGLVLSAPAYLVGSAIPPLKVAVGRMLAQVVPTLRLPNKADFEAISRVPEVVKAYEKDPLAFHFNTLQQGNEILKALPKVPSLIRQIPISLFIAHGTADRIIKPEGSYLLLRQAASKDKELHYLPLGYHEPHNDLDKEQYFTVLTRWLGERCLKPTPISESTANSHS